LQVNLKVIIPLLSLVAMLGGFYYTTELRLNQLEGSSTILIQKVESLSIKVGTLDASIRKLNRQLKKGNK